MTGRRRTPWVKVAALLSSAVLIPGLSCVTRVASTVGEGITAVGSAGVRGTAAALETGISLVGGILGVLSG